MWFNAHGFKTKGGYLFEQSLEERRLHTEEIQTRRMRELSREPKICRGATWVETALSCNIACMPETVGAFVGWILSRMPQASGQSFSRSRTLAFRSQCLSLANTCSIRSGSGLQGGRNRSSASTSSIAFRTASPLREPGLSMTTMPPGLSAGAGASSI